MKKPPDARADAALEHAAQAFAEAGELLPTNEALVASEEADQTRDEALELPKALESFRAQRPARQAGRTGEIHDLAQARRARTPWLNYAVAALLGAAAAAVLLLTLQPEKDPISIGPSGETSQPVKQPDTPALAISLSSVACSEACCAGARCSRARTELAECPSGRSCVDCQAPQAAERYRLRVGTLALTSAGLEAVAKEKWQKLSLCLKVGSSDFACVPAHAGSDTAATWTSLPLVASSQDGLAGFELEVRANGHGKAVASWRGPVAINPTVLCKGLSLQPKLGAETFGSVSLFLDDTHFVELERSALVRPLEEYRRQFRGPLRPRVFQLAGNPPAFALSVGPLGHGEARKLRWQLLELGKRAKVVLGHDYLEARP